MPSNDAGKARPSVLKHDLGPIDLAPSAGTMEGDGVKLPVSWLDEAMMNKWMDLVIQSYKDNSGGINMLKEPESLRTVPSRKELGLGAKRALLIKHGFLLSDKDKDTPSNEDVEQMWLQLWENFQANSSVSDNENENARQQQMQMLLDLIHTKKSNGNSLKWTIMDCLPGTKFQLHAHPNIELVYCLQGELHEIRISGAPITTKFETKRKEDGSKVQVGPNLQDCKRSWYFDTLKEGHWLVNEVGSIHQSFTSSNKGCILVALWSDHADIENSMQPKGFLVADVIDEVDKKLCCNHDDSQTKFVGETFLPPSERSQT